MSQTLATLRQAGAEQFAALGWPNRRVEAYKYSDLTGLAHSDLGEVVVQSLGNLPNQSGLRCFTAAEAPQALQAKIGSLLPLEDPLAAYSTAHLSDVLVIEVAANTKLDSPLVLDHRRLAGQAAFARYLVVVGSGAEVELIERYASSGQGVSSPVIEVFVEAGAQLRHLRSQTESLEATHLGWTAAHVARDATYSHFALNQGAGLSRHNIRVDLAGNGAHLDLFGLHLLDGKQSCDSHTRINHNAPHTTSNEVYKSVVGGSGNSIFQGKIYVAKDSQKIVGNQMSRGLLLGPRARVHNKPELEIYADDVICSHGSTVGALDEQAIFYLRARGIPEAVAQKMMVEAFVQDVLEELGETAEVTAHWQAVISAYLSSVFASSQQA